MKTIISSTVFCFALGVTAAVIGAPVLTFEETDANADGYISKQEAKAYKDLYSNWDKVDTNKDGRADSKEFTRFESTGRFEPPEDSETSELGAAPH